MCMEFALRYVTTLRSEDVFNRMFLRNDVFPSLDVDLLSQGGQGCRFSTSNRSGNEDQAVMITSQQFQVLGQTELVHGANACIDDSENNISAKTLADDTGAISSFFVGIGKVGIAAFIHQRALRIGQKRVGQLLCLFLLEPRGVRPDWPQRAM